MTIRTLSLLIVLGVTAVADGERDNQVDNVRRIPPAGVKVPDADKAELSAGLDALGKEIDAIRAEQKGKATLHLLPDVEIYHKAVRYALQYDEFFNPKDIATAKNQLQLGLYRAKQLREGTPNWWNTRGMVSLGYVSKIDGSVQPYNLLIPVTWSAGQPDKHRLDTWFHGRGETLSELNFLNQKNTEFQPKDAFVLSLYGRYCCANKLAGEVDLFEALDDVKKRYPIDENRIVVRGFSMGGAACWQFAVHFAGKWAAAAPGAGFSETADFLKVFQNEKVQPTDYEQKLWHMYDCTDYAVNLFNCPTVAYSGEIDKQKQAADMMAEAMKKEGLELTHLIGPKTAHAYEKAAKEELIRRIDEIAAKGRNPVPRKIRFTTWTLLYNEMLWVTVDGMGQHWERARVDAELAGDSDVHAKTSNVTALTFSMEPGRCPLDESKRVKVTLDDQTLEAPAPGSDRSWHASFHKDGGKWAAGPLPDALRKRHGLQGPIDDAFMDSFLMVKPTGAPLSEKTGAWAAKELDHAITHWRQQYRGDARVTTDQALSEEDIARHHLVLW
ncbi:MAG TPA: prolyl oligopeptidase family serine peptidase, partial [Planctomycetota bacterium]|nr:prolyl oligopeptidase family serine peptidase [Planctomycetota bacterium]